MCDKAIVQNRGTLISVPDCYNIHEMCNKAVDNYPHALEVVSKCFMTQGMCDKVAKSHSSTIQFVPECYKTQKICDKAFNKLSLHFFIFLTNIKFKKCVAELFLMILFQ